MQVVMNSGGYLCVMILTIKRHDLGGYEEITACILCRYENSEFVPSITTPTCIYTSRSRLREGFASDNHYNHRKTPHTSIFYFTQKGYLFSYPRIFDRYHTGAPNLKGVLIFFVFLTGPIRIGIVCDEESPPHASLLPLSM